MAQVLLTICATNPVFSELVKLSIWHKCCRNILSLTDKICRSGTSCATNSDLQLLMIFQTPSPQQPQSRESRTHRAAEPTNTNQQTMIITRKQKLTILPQHTTSTPTSATSTPEPNIQRKQPSYSVNSPLQCTATSNSSTRSTLHHLTLRAQHQHQYICGFRKTLPIPISTPLNHTIKNL